MVKICPRCGTPNDDFSPVCVRCGYQFPPPTGYNPPPYVPPAGYTPPPYGKKKKSTPIVAVLILVILVVAIGGYLYYKGVFTPARAPVVPPIVVTTHTSIMSTTVRPPQTSTTVQPTPTTTSPPPPSTNKYCAVSFNGKDQYFVTPQFNVTVNGENTTVGLFSYVAMKYHEETIAIRAYLTPNTRGVLIGLSGNTLPFNIPYIGWSPLVYMSDGKLIIAEITDTGPSFPNGKAYEFIKVGVGRGIYPRVNGGEAAMCVNITSPGFYWIVFEEWTTGNDTYVAGYINGELIAEFYAPVANASSLFGAIGPYEYNFVGIAYTYQWPLTNGQWYPFNGSINTIAVYPYVLSQSQVGQLASGPLPPGYFALFIASSKWYNQATGIWQAYNNPELELMTNGSSPLIIE
ncbi:hypothetical protein [Stygiolobus caldivivus]|uniref:Zinc-ribbon domain-containing protein n=1 Tax=Stygiolobus caldivivus TaxID=2824673 RepID=A0A8D5U5B2_9CREN|nr:hypothetical protein [Stygiolobus caldivivus]BCU69746.1 hypothetical protein KN1_10430 [Stygiolobus caldivivus]